MNHNDVRHRISEYIDGALSDIEKKEVEAHLESCPRCADAFRELRQTIEHIRSIEEVDPPAWMTGKIMARVRAGEEKKKSRFRRLFFPLHIKLPLEATGVLFLAVTAFFIYQNMRPALELPEGPSQVLADRQKATRLDQTDQSRRRAQEPKKVPQKPEYKALDMKREYEPAPPPIVQERKQAAPVPSPAPSSGYFSKGDADKESKPESEISATKPDRFSGFDEREGYSHRQGYIAGNQEPAKAKQAAPLLRQDSNRKSGIILIVRNVPSSAEQLERAIKQLEGTIVKREAAGDGMVIITALIDRVNQRQLRERLKRIGELMSGDAAGQDRDGKTILEIRIVPQQP